MSETGNTTILSLALWLKEAPLHNISAMIHLEKTNYLVSGCEKGHIIIWSLNPDGNEMTPLHYFIGHKSKVTNFVLAGSNRNTNLDYFVSFSGDGEIGLWEASEGRNIEFISNPQMDIQYVFSYESYSTKVRFIFCCLRNREIFILNSMSLSHICTLVCTSSPNWFSSITSFSKSVKDDVIRATTISGLVAIWVINFTDVLNQDQQNLVIDADEYVDISTINPLKISHNPHFPDLIIVITPSQFKIYHTHEWTILAYQDCRRGDYFIDGDFINYNTVLIHTQSGKSVYYVLPKRSNYQDPLFMEESKSLCDNIPMSLFEFGEPEKDLQRSRHKVFTQIYEDKFIFWKGFSNGNIYKWEFVSKSNDQFPLNFSLEKCWLRLKKRSSSLTNSLKNTSPIGIVTSLLIIEDFSVIVLGMDNGLILIRNINDALLSAFTEGDLNSSEHITLKGHVGPVTCLMHPSSNMKVPTLMTSVANFRSKTCLNILKLTHILWSGGQDYTIRVWNIKTEQMLNIFHCHSAPILSFKLHRLPINSATICGFSQGFTGAMFNTIHDDDENSYDIKQMINICMNAFLVGIADNDGISILSIMKQKLVLYTAEHKCPVKNLGWIIDSGYLLVETIEQNVYVWDLSSGTMDRYETGEKAKSLMENCRLITKIRSKANYDLLIGSRFVKRHSLFSISETGFASSATDKLLRFQFLHSGSVDRYVPVLIINLSTLLDSLNAYNQISSTFCDMLAEINDSPLKDTNSCNHSRAPNITGLDFLLHNAKSDRQNLTLKTLLMKIILSQTDLSKNDNSSSDSLIPNINEVSYSLGQVNSKTGCIVFQLKSLFTDSLPEPISTLENMLIQLAISNKIISISKLSIFEGFLDNYTANGNGPGLMDPVSLSSLSGVSISSSSHRFSSITVKSFKVHRKLILGALVSEYLKIFDGDTNYLSFNLLEKICNLLILRILDICDTISKSSLQLLAKIISNLTDQQIQNYILMWRLFLSPNVDNNCMDDNRKFLLKIQPLLDKFIEHSYLSSDWIWWYSRDPMKTQHDKRNLSKIQIKALLNIALVGSHLLPDDIDKPDQTVQLFSKLFSLDKSFLARITCDFLMSVLSRKPKKSKSNVGRLINLSMICLSFGFLVWEPYLDSNSVICQFLKFAIDMEDPSVDDKFLSIVSRKAIEDIASVRPLVFIMVCYREMLRLSHITSSNSSIDKHKSFPTLPSSGDHGSFKGDKVLSLLNRNILIPIFNDLCQNQSTTILDVLPELVELYIYFYIRDEDFSSFMLPVLKFTSVSVNELFGHISVGSVNGYLYLFDFKIGKYFYELAHKKSIRITKFSDDAKFLASYSLQENNIKIWQISSNLFNLSNNPYQVKRISSHNIPSIKQMIAATNLSAKHIQLDHLLDKDEDVYLEWESDNKSLFIKLNGLSLKHIKI